MTPEEYWIKYQPKPVTPAYYDQMTFGFDIEQMHTKTINGTPNVVYKVNYYVWGEYQGEQGRVSQELTFPQEVLDEQVSFIPYDELTKETVIGWIEDNTSYIHTQYTIANQLDVPSDDTPPLPW
jgi:hypothetical protein